MKIPTFRWMGGKARLRKWLVDKFPKNGNEYFEPFAGLGNVFYLSATQLDFRSWWLNDTKGYDFLYDVRLNAEWIKLPEKITEQLKKELLENQGTLLSNILENVVTFGGKGYSAGFTSDIEKRYNPESYSKRLIAAKKLLEKAAITRFDAVHIVPYDSFGSDDFIYFDPPYYGTKASYPNIDHEKLIEIINNLECKWALSGYDNPLYAEKLKFVNRFQIERNSEIKSSSKGKYTAVTETLWTNY